MKKNKSKNTKNGVLLIIFGVVVFTSMIIVVGTNFIINKYINDQAWETLNQEATWFRDIENSQAFYDKAPAPLFQASFILLDFGYDAENADEEMGYGRDVDQKRIYKYYLENKDSITLDNIQLAEIDGSKYYYIKTAYKDKSISQKNGEVLIYISIDPINRLTGILNGMFAIMILPTVVVAIVAGMKAGSMIEDSQEKLKHFFENASHELKTPLMSIQGYAEGIREGIIPDYAKAAGVILDESDRMERLVEGILQLSRLDSGARSMNMEVINICELLREATFRIAYIASSKGVDVKIELPMESIFVNCDDTAIDQVFDNVLSNGMRHAKSCLKVTCIADSGRVVVSIIDDGEGIDSEDLPHIFERFYRGKNGNTGIGMALSKDIVDRHRGKISVTCNNEGTKFTISLPLAN